MPGLAGHDHDGRTVLVMARRLDLTIVAEGVETQRTWARLRDLGCHHAQGFLVSRPLAAEDLEAWSATGFDDRLTTAPGFVASVRGAA